MGKSLQSGKSGQSPRLKVAMGMVVLVRDESDWKSACAHYSRLVPPNFARATIRHFSCCEYQSVNPGSNHSDLPQAAADTSGIEACFGPSPCLKPHIC